MLVYAGIDEAGYGPMLGPLCVGLAVIPMPDRSPERAPDLWRTFRKAVTRAKRDVHGRIAIDDSKKLKGAGEKGHPLRHLERGVLSFLAQSAPEASPLPADCAAYLERVGTGVPDCPWYAARHALPVGHDAGSLRIAASRLRRVLDAAGAGPPLLQCTAIDAGPFNDAVARLGRKSTVNMHAVMGLVNVVWSRWPDDHPRVMVDRQGGRRHYRDELQCAFPESTIRIVAESAAVSRYVLERSGSRLTISFSSEAEDRHLPVALASMIAKYTRELLMLRLNAHFTSLLPELKPTAGYVEDARRYLADLGGLVDDLPGGREALVRSV